MAVTRSLRPRVPASHVGDVAALPIDVVSAVDRVGPISLGVSPLRGAGLLRCASSRCQRPSVSPLRAAIPHAGSPLPSALAGAQGVAGLRRVAPGRCARQCSDQGCAFIAMPNSQVRPAMPAGMTTAALSRAQGSRALFPSRVRERGPLDELTGVPVTSLRCTPTRSASPPIESRRPT
jgi:hypothetical protein